MLMLVVVAALVIYLPVHWVVSTYDHFHEFGWPSLRLPLWMKLILGYVALAVLYDLLRHL